MDTIEHNGDQPPSDVVLLTCGMVSPALLDATGPRFQCAKKIGHAGDHAATLEWSREPQLLEVYPWETPRALDGIKAALRDYPNG